MSMFTASDSLEMEYADKHNWRNDKSLKDIMKFSIWPCLGTNMDVRFFCGEARYRVIAHSGILRTVSRVFQDMTQKYRGPDPENMYFELPHISSYSMRLFIHFVYTRRETLDIKEALGLVDAAHFFKVKFLENLCVSEMNTVLNASNAIKILVASAKNNLTMLHQKTTEFINRNALDILESMHPIRMNDQEIFYFAQINHQNNSDIFTEAIIKWAQSGVRITSRSPAKKVTASEIRNELGNAYDFLNINPYLKEKYNL